MYRWTVDVDGGDWGGRTQDQLGIKYGLPKILELFRRHKVKGLFFISTEALVDYRDSIWEIKNQGHAIGSHGHFHIKWKDAWRAREDKRISKLLLTTLNKNEDSPYRAPKFCFDDGNIYANPKNHVGLLKHMWFGSKITKETIFYLHPFDIVKGDNPPNLFCRIWYSNPKRALETLENLLKCYGH